MLRGQDTTRQLLPIMLILLFSLNGSASRADPASIVEPPPGMVEEFMPGSPLSLAYVMAGGPEDSVWFPAATATMTTMFERISRTGVITGEFVVPGLNGAEPVPENGLQVRGLAMGDGGDMWFTDQAFGGAFVGRVTSSGKTSEFGLPASTYPEGIAAGPDGDMWFAAGAPGKIEQIGKDGAIKEYEIPTGTHDDLPEVSKPTMIALGADGNMWFTDQGDNSQGQSFIGRITPSGAISEFPIATQYGTPSWITLGADGNMWFSQPYASKIGRISPDGAISEFIVPSMGSEIASGSDGNIWFTEGFGPDIVGRITPAGAVTTFSPISAVAGGPRAITAGADGDLWFSSYDFFRVDRLIIPKMPVNSGAPSISGEIAAGQVVSVSDGSWLNDPDSFAYQWQVCDGSGRGCIDSSGDVGTTHALTAADVGHTLRAVVTASNLGGSASVVSSTSPVVRAAPPAMLATTIPTPTVGATMTWSFRWLRLYSIVKSLVLSDLPADGSIEVVCKGRGCPFSHRRLPTTTNPRLCESRKCTMKKLVRMKGDVDLTSLFRNRRLRVGARIVVNVTKTGWLGRAFLFTVLSNKAPRARRECGVNLSFSRHTC